MYERTLIQLYITMLLNEIMIKQDHCSERKKIAESALMNPRAKTTGIGGSVAHV